MRITKKTKCAAAAVVLLTSYAICFRLLQVEAYVFAFLPNMSVGNSLRVSVADYSHRSAALRVFYTGEAELQLLREYERLVRYDNYSSINTKQSPSSYTFTVLDVTVSNYSLSFTINQQLKQHVNGTIPPSSPLIGGASFYITVIGERHWSTCRATDSFNGRYVVECPMYDTCVSVTATVYYTDYGTFYIEDLGLGAYSVFWTQTVCKPSDSMLDYSALDLTYVGWYRTKSSSSWIWMDRGMEVKSKEELRTCLYGLHSAGVPVSFVGDSHLRMVFHYVMDLFKDSTARTKVRNAIAFRNFNYTYATTLEKQQPTFPTFLPSAQRLLSSLIRDGLPTHVDNVANVTTTSENKVTSGSSLRDKARLSIVQEWQVSAIHHSFTWNVGRVRVQRTPLS
jgi:hypothetical protein